MQHVLCNIYVTSSSSAMSTVPTNIYPTTHNGIIGRVATYLTPYPSNPHTIIDTLYNILAALDVTIGRVATQQ
jgi:hypothetical protein